MATEYKYSTISGAERAYKRAVKKLICYLIDTGALGIVELKQTSTHKKIPVEIYEYRAVHRFSNEDDCVGKIKFNFREKTAEIITLANGDTCKTNIFARTAIHHIWRLDVEERPKKLTISVKLMPICK